ncbi:hypothetical protein [Lactobacillus selangorensis]|nr:hypothetical protein [Lactobacillus selangorensis]
MKISLVKLPALYNTIFFLVSIVEIVLIAIFLGGSNNLSWATLVLIYSNIEAKVFWLGIIAIILHVISYLDAMNQPWVLTADLIGIAAHILLIFVPSFFYISLILIWLSIFLTLRKAYKHKHLQTRA